ncbi:MAG: hypothetical protein IT384_26305 [Deltaproteobacteria bacterium]|nr:hypothetical protein [Deltaproteobacteria bacterium]
MTFIGYSNPLLIQLGLPTDLLMSHAAGLPAFALPGLHQGYLEALGPAALLGGIPGGLQAQAGLIPLVIMPSPSMARSVSEQICGGGYARPRQRMDLANYMNADGFGPGAGDSVFHRLFSPNRRAAARLEHALRNDDFLRAQFEQAVGGRIVDFGKKGDGKITIERFSPAQSALSQVAANPAAFQLNQLLQGMQGAAAQQAQSLGLLTGAATGLAALLGTGNPFLAVTLGGLAGIAASLFGGGLGGGFGGAGLGGAGFGGGFGGNGTGAIGGTLGGGPFGFNMLNGAGVGSWNPLAAPGHINNTNPAYENAHQAQVASVLNDPSLSVEDKVMLMLALIMKKMDDDIERQMQYINSLQNQQANRQGGKKGGGGGKGAGGGSGGPSVDVEMQKLQRMITKRAQIFEMASNIMKKYDDTARAAIQKMNG